MGKYGRDKQKKKKKRSLYPNRDAVQEVKWKEEMSKGSTLD